MNTLLHTHSWLKWDDDDEAGFKEKFKYIIGINNKQYIKRRPKIDSQHMSLSGTADSGTDRLSHHSLEGPGRG